MALTGVPELGGWRVTPSPTPAGTTPPELTITYATDDFATALALANRIGEAAEAADHEVERVRDLHPQTGPAALGGQPAPLGEGGADGVHGVLDPGTGGRGAVGVRGGAP